MEVGIRSWWGAVLRLGVPADPAERAALWHRVVRHPPGRTSELIEHAPGPTAARHDVDRPAPVMVGVRGVPGLTGCRDGEVPPAHHGEDRASQLLVSDKPAGVAQGDHPALSKARLLVASGVMSADAPEGIGQTVPIEPLESRLDVSLLGVVEDRLASTQERRHLIATTLTGHPDHAATGVSGPRSALWLALARRSEPEVDDVGAKRVQCAVGLVTDVEETVEDRLTETVHRGAP